MHYPIIATAAAALALAACGKQPAPEPQDNAAGATEQAQAEYAGTGKVTAIAGDQVTIDHGPIEGIGWPAMAMTFTAPPGMAAGVEVGSDVSFAFRQDGGSYVLTRLERR